VSMVLLYWTLYDQVVEFSESLTLLAAAMVYLVAVYFTTDVAEMILGAKAALPSSTIPSTSPTKQISDQSERQVSDSSDLPSFDAMRRRQSSFHGVEVQVEAVIHNHMTDAVNPLKMNMDAMSFDREAGIDIASAKSPRIVKRPSFGPQLEDMQDGVQGGPSLQYKDLKEVVVLSEGVIELEFCPHAWEHVTLRLKCETSAKRDELLAKIREHSLGRPWEHEYDPSVFFAFTRFKHGLTGDYNIVEKLLAVPELFIGLCLMSTLSLVDVKDIRKEDRWLICFLGGMTWLAFESYFMLGACDCIHYHIPSIPTSYLGFTILAVGTSFPNAVASVILAQQGKPAAAVANALASNVQNVFLAMAFPWAFFSAQSLNFGAVPLDVDGVSQGVVWMLGTLALLLLLALWTPSFTLSKSHGILLILVYVAYVVDVTVDQFLIDVCPSLVTGFLC